jgi:hypothetical protein
MKKTENSEDRGMHAAGMSRFGQTVLVGILVASSQARADGIELPGGGKVGKVDFERHIMGLFGRMGCNSGSCHGSFQGKGGFRLSLFGYEPEKDFRAITRDLQGRRVDRNDPDNSLLLLKATGVVEHAGQRRFGKGTWAYQLFRAWIVQGATWTKASGEVASLHVTPQEYAFAKAGQRGQLHVTARFADGNEEDVTPLCDFRTNDDGVAEVTSLGEVKTVRGGDTAIIVSYRGNVLPVRVLVPGELPAGAEYPEVAEANFIDQGVFAKLRRLNIIPSELCDDATFLRRVTIDTIGTLPTPDDVRAFLSDDQPDKRARKIDELLSHPMHAALWATKFCDVTGNDTDLLENPGPPLMRPKMSQMWHDWFRKRLAENTPYDEIVHGVLCATTREGKGPEEYLKSFKDLEAASVKGFDTPYAKRETLDLFWRRQVALPPEQWGEKVAAAFLGVRLECAQCHKHPFDRWTQNDYRSFANVFGKVAVGVSPEAQKIFRPELDERAKAGKGKAVPPRLQLREVFIGGKPRALTDPDTGKPLPAKAPGGPEIITGKEEDARVLLFQWMKTPDNPYFARSFANRVWGHYLGPGIVQPVDDFSLANPASNPGLLDALARSFVESGFDIRKLERAVLNSRTYQLSSVTNATNRLDRTNFSHAYIRPMMAEVVVDVVNAALGVSEKFGADAPPGCRAIEVGASRLQNPAVAYAFRIFGRPPRSSACDCERSMEPGLSQKLYLMADGTVVAKLQSPQNRLKALLTAHRDDESALEELFLATVSRPPTEKEKARFVEYRGEQKDRRKVFADTLWALLNTTEFVFNH